MKKSINIKAAIYPMPVLMVATYDENGTVDVMNAAWGTQCSSDKLVLCLSARHKTAKNLRLTGACTVALADAAHMKEADYFGIASGNDMADKFERSGLTAVKSNLVNAPVIEEFPLTMECELLEEIDGANLHCFIVKVVGTLADERILKEDGKICVHRLDALTFNQFRNKYFTTGEKAGDAWGAGKELM
ncbi:MAG: flavin reductase family protein [Lachnospiraceae bacterium]|nr:flavin reductase family protein [Lachnospiraceae bacterium]